MRVLVPLRRRWRPILCLTTLGVATFLWSQPLRALDERPSAGISLQQLEEFRANGIPEDGWPLLLEALGRPEQGAAIRTLLKDQEPFPAARLVALLSHPKLTVRLGALDLLEDVSGDTFGFDPWQEDPAAGGNANALARWKAWTEGDTKASAQSVAPLTPETFRVLALEIMTGDRDKAERAMERLEGYGLAAIAHVEAFLKSQPTLEEGPRALLKAAEYRVAIRQALPKSAAGLARDLALGRPEAQSTALAALGEAGPGVLPVIAEIFGSTDPLVRETAVDAAFKAGKRDAVPMVLDLIRNEKTESVLHAALRGLGQHAYETAHIDAVAGLLQHPAENVAVSALEAIAVSRVGDVTEALASKLTDANWRVRAATLEAIEKRGLESLKDEVSKRLRDDDLFVRVSAVNTLKTIGRRGSTNALIDEFERQDDLKPPILRALFSNNSEPPGRVWESLSKAPPEVILQCLDLLEDRDDRAGKRIRHASRFVSHPNRDVAASALRVLASRGQSPARLLEAMRSEDDLRRDAVLDALRLPPGFFGEKLIASESPQASSGRNTVLDRLYSIFGGSRQAPATPDPATVTTTKTEDVPTEIRQVLEQFLRAGSPRQRFQAALTLTGQGHEEAAQFLLNSYDTFSSLDRRGIGLVLENLSQWKPGAQLELATRLLRDDADDVREKAIDAWLDSKNTVRFKGLLDELARPGSPLKPDDLYGYEVDTLAQNAGVRSMIFNWGKKVLDDAAAPEPVKIFALILLGRSGQATEAEVERFVESDRPLLRRAAYRALGAVAVEARLETLLKDDSALVRAVVPFLASPHNNGWLHWLSDATSVRDYEDIGGSRYDSGAVFGSWAQKARRSPGATASPAMISALERLARDPSDGVRFEALFSLLRLGRPADPAAIAALVASQPDSMYSRQRLGDFLENNYSRLNAAYGVLVPLVTQVSEQNRPKLLRHFGLEQEKAFTSFTALAQLAPSVAFDTPVAEVETVSVAALTNPVPQAFRAIFFYKPGCRECDRVRDMLQRHAASLPHMQIEERDINAPENALLNEALSARFHLRDTMRQVTPAVFTQAGSLVKDDITFPRLGDLLRQSETLSPDPVWAEVGVQEVAVAQQTIVHRYETLSFAIVAAAGLLDGINPCAFATIIFLLSYLQVARRSSREILAVGAAFVLGVFLAYFVVGLGLAQALTKLTALRYLGTALNYMLAGFALVVAALSFRDARLAAQGQHGEMTLQLPGILKERIRSTVRTGTRSRHFVLAAFGAGLVISILELACTGQVYLPTILYMVRSGESGAVRHLLLYNAAFVAPLVVVFLLAWSGLRSERLILFQKRNMTLVKVLTGVLFLLLAAMLIFGSALLPRKILL